MPVFLIEIDQVKLLFDPYISPNLLAQAVDIDTIQAGCVLLSHGYYGHVADVEQVYCNYPATLVANLEMINWHEKEGITKSSSISPGEKQLLDFDTVKVMYEPHASSMSDESYAGNAIRFIIRSSKKTFYFARATALHQDMKQISTLDDIHFAIFPVGHNFIVGIEKALYAADYVGIERIIGMCYDSFYDIEIDHKRAKCMADEQGKILTLMGIGQTIEF